MRGGGSARRSVVRMLPSLFGGTAYAAWGFSGAIRSRRVYRNQPFRLSTIHRNTASQIMPASVT